ncbi:hypothetical protein BST61_g2854 [Cercospora zeina]
MSAPRRLLSIAPRLWRSRTSPSPTGIRFGHLLRYKRGPEHSVPRFKNADEILEKSTTTTIDIDDAKTLLQTSFHKIQSLPSQKRANAAAQVGAGKILQWLLGRDPKTWDEDVSATLADFLCWHVEAERLQETVVPSSSSPVTDWLDQAPGSTSSWGSNGAPSWAIRVFSSHVKALLYWHNDLEFALQATERYIDQLPNGRPLGHLHDALTETTTKIHGNGRASQDSFDRYLKLPLHERRRAVAMLYHPTIPDAMPYYHLQQPNLCKPAGKIEQYRGMPAHYKIAIQILKAQGRHREAQEMDLGVAK